MKFLNDISELDNCDCDRIISHDGIGLTGYIEAKYVPRFVSSSTYTLTVTAYDLDGNLLGDFSADFFWSIQQNLDGKVYFTLTSMRLPDALCTAKCFYLRVKLDTILDNGLAITAFDKYTSCFKVENCCIIPSGIDITFEPETTT